MRNRLAVFLSVATLGVALLAASTPAGASASTPSARLQRLMAFKPLHPVAYARAKAAANVAAGVHARTTPALGSGTPSAFVSFQGQDMLSPLMNLAPSDSTGAIGTGRYVELINQRIGVYDRTGTPLSSGSLAGFTGLSTSTDSLFDVQVIWDPGQERFFFAMDDIRGSSNLLAYGFSKTDSPDSLSSSWCTYSSDFGVYGTHNAFPDYPKLGDTKDFILIGVNTFNNAGTIYKGSDVAWVTKPPAGAITTCPDPGSFFSGVKRKLKNEDGSLTSTPVPANQTDTSSTGWIVSDHDVSLDSSTALTVFKVQKKIDISGNPFARIGKGADITVAAYSMPPSAPQAGTPFVIDTLDARLTQAVSGIDPSRVTSGKGLAIWTQHTVLGGAGSEVRWYEIDPVAQVTFQAGQVTDQTLYAFNGAISPDRRVNGSSKQFGGNMVLGFNTSSPGTDVAIQMVSKVGANPQSAPVLVQQSLGPDADFTCTSPYGPPCRWGDYAGASPDPASPTGGNAGQVWQTSMWNTPSTNNTNVDWTTWNWGATP